MRKDFFRQGFEPFGRPVQLNGGVTPGQPLQMAGARPTAVPLARPVMPRALSTQMARPAASRPTMAGPQRPIQVYQKGDPNAPPCPVCG